MAAELRNVPRARSVDDIVPVLMRLRMSSDEGEAAYDWFIRVYVARLKALMKAERSSGVKPRRTRVIWPSPSAVAKGFDTPHLSQSALDALGAALVKIGFRLPAVSKGPIDLRLVTFPATSDPYDRWLYVRLLVDAAAVLRHIDEHADGLTHLVHDYVLNVTCASAEHFALAWLVGPYRDQLQRDSERDPERSDTHVAYGKIIIPDVLRVAMDRRIDTERVAHKHWGNDPRAVGRAWVGIADLFGRLGFPSRSAPDAVLRFNRVINNVTPSPHEALLRIAAIDVPSSPVKQAALRVAIEELADQHALVHHRLKKRIRFDKIKQTGVATAAATPADPFATLIATMFVESGVPLAGCFEDDDDDDDDADDDDDKTGHVLPDEHAIVVPVIGTPNSQTADEIRALQETVRALTTLVASQKEMIDKASIKSVEEDRRDAEIAAETSRLRAELAALRKEADTLRKVAETSVTAAGDAAELAGQLSKTPVTQTIVPFVGPAREIKVSPPPPPPDVPQRLATLNSITLQSKAAIKRANQKIQAAGERIDNKLAKVERKATENADGPLFSASELQKGRDGLRKVDAAVVALEKQKKSKTSTSDGDDLVAALKKVFVVRRRATGDGNDNTNAADGLFESRVTLRARLAMAMYEAMNYHA